MTHQFQMIFLSEQKQPKKCFKFIWISLTWFCMYFIYRVQLQKYVATKDLDLVVSKIVGSKCLQQNLPEIFQPFTTLIKNALFLTFSGICSKLQGADKH